MNTHVFIVDPITFKVHLEYLFAGTGAKEHFIDFNNKKDTKLYHSIENMLVSMIADADRVRRGDFVIFYLQQDYQKKIFEGKFYGIFKVKEDHSFLDNNDKKQYLIDKLEKSLTFRTIIEPYKVYPEGVTEWEALDEIKNIQSPHQMLWSLIYRKLKGNRGDTMITVYESEKLFQLIRNKNKRKELECEDKLLSFDQEKQEIICLGEKRNSYNGRKEKISILLRLKEKMDKGKSFEPHLQAYILENIGKGTNDSLDKMIPNGALIEWIGNEVSCGVGMQRIDIMLSVMKEEQRIIMPIELKTVRTKRDIVGQIQRYVDWVEQYYIPNRQSDIQPVLITPEIKNRDKKDYEELINNFKIFNKKNSITCNNLVYIEFSIDNGNLFFKRINY